jgi:hypothetical protein
MSFKLFVYYCAVCGGWAALIAWGLVEWLNLPAIDSEWKRTISIGGVVGLWLAAAVGAMDALLNAVGFQRLFRVLVCLGVGLGGGVFGSALGQLLPNRGLPLFLGWMIVGIMIGTSIAVFDVVRAVRAAQAVGVAVRKLVNGIIGGLLGGCVGGLLVQWLQDQVSLPRSRLAIGLVALGTSIGLLIGLAQIILKEAWIKVENGVRAGREMMLSRAETTIGKAESCDIGLFGDSQIERLHARILLQGNRYLLADAGSSTGTFLNEQAVTQPVQLRSGDAIRVGSSVLRFGERQKRPISS